MKTPNFIRKGSNNNAMFRNLIIIIAIVVLVWIVRNMLRRNQVSGSSASPRISKDMVQCEQCQTYLPKDDAISNNGHYFCGEKHLQAWKRDH